MYLLILEQNTKVKLKTFRVIIKKMQIYYNFAHCKSINFMKKKVVFILCKISDHTKVEIILE